MATASSQAASIFDAAGLAANVARSLKDEVASIISPPEHLQQFHKKLGIFENTLGTLDEPRIQNTLQTLGAQTGSMLDDVFKESKILCEEGIKALEGVTKPSTGGEVTRQGYIALGYWEAGIIKLLEERLDSISVTLNYAIGKTLLYLKSDSDPGASIYRHITEIKTSLKALEDQAGYRADMIEDANTESKSLAAKSESKPSQGKILASFLTTAEAYKRMVNSEILLYEAVLAKVGEKYPN